MLRQERQDLRAQVRYSFCSLHHVQDSEPECPAIMMTC